MRFLAVAILVLIAASEAFAGSTGVAIGGVSIGNGEAVSGDLSVGGDLTVVGDVTATSFTSTPVDGSNQIGITNNTVANPYSCSPTAGSGALVIDDTTEVDHPYFCDDATAMNRFALFNSSGSLVHKDSNWSAANSGAGNFKRFNVWNTATQVVLGRMNGGGTDADAELSFDVTTGGNNTERLFIDSLATTDFKGDGAASATGGIRVFDSGNSISVKISAESAVVDSTWSVSGITGRVAVVAAPTTITAATDTPASQTFYGHFFVVENGGTGSDISLPSAVAGQSACYYSKDAGVIILDAAAGDDILLDGASNGVAEAIDSPGAAGDSICLKAIDATNWVTLNRVGAWIPGGAD